MGNLKATSTNRALPTHTSIWWVYRARNAPVICFSKMRLTAAALWSTGESVAKTCAARRRGSQNSKSSLSDIWYSYERRGDVIEVNEYACAVWTGGEAPTLGRIRVSRPRLERGRVFRGDGPRLVAMKKLLPGPILQGERGQTEEAVGDDDEKRKVRAFGKD